MSVTGAGARSATARAASITLAGTDAARLGFLAFAPLHKQANGFEPEWSFDDPETAMTARCRIIGLTLDVACIDDPDGELHHGLLDVAAESPDVLPEPEPIVWFQDFADSALLFRLVTYTSKVTGRFGVASSLRTEIFERLGKAGIEIPFPQRVLRLAPGTQLPISEVAGGHGDAP